MNEPIVSVCMITYNHQDYIKQALHGLRIQKCNFKVELIVCDDASTDSTGQAIHDNWQDTPNIYLRYIRHEKNIGMIPNFIYALQQCNGAYIAICEGDDYWTDPLKLQKQVDFLEQNPSYTLCFHKVKIYNEENQQFEDDTITRPVSKTTTLRDVAKGNYIHTPSVMLRNTFVLPDWFKKVFLGDWSLYMIAVGKSKIRKLPETMAVYRVSGSAAWSTQHKSFRKKSSRSTVAIVAENAQLPKAVKSILYSRLNRKSVENKPIPLLQNKLRTFFRALDKWLFSRKNF